MTREKKVALKKEKGAWELDCENKGQKEIAGSGKVVRSETVESAGCFSDLYLYLKSSCRTLSRGPGKIRFKF